VRRGLDDRPRALGRLEASVGDVLDLVIVGGGITGAGIALDAASRGLSVGLIERNDFASGTSSKSSKLVHGGLRYLEQREFGLVREASTERDLLTRLAPHLVEPIPFVIPVSGRTIRAKFGVGLWAYDALASFKNLKVHRYIDREETERMVPPLPRGKLRGGFVYYDAKTDDSRLVLEVLVQATRHGAIVANHLSVEHIDADGEVKDVSVRDTLDGRSFSVRARRVIVAAGVWSDVVESRTKPDAEPRLRPSKGIHIVLTRSAMPLAESAAFIPDIDKRRMLFVIPWHDAVLVGTTDDAYEGDIDAPSVTKEDRNYCLDSLNAAFGMQLTEDDIAGAYAGLRPLIQGKKGATADLSRRHAIFDIAPGVLGITGGKLTTYRRMAQDAVDRIAEDLGSQNGSKTRWIRLGSSDVMALRNLVRSRALRMGVSEIRADHLVRSYGERSLDVLDIAEAEDLTAPLARNHLPIAAEAAYAARAEMAVHLSDLLSRRTRLSLVDHAAGAGDDGMAVKVMSRELSWDRRRAGSEITVHRHAVSAERGMIVPDRSPELPEPDTESVGVS
jgi:glycerol-3-phosphate dehydrogenase